MMREIFTARGESNLGIARLAWISFFVVLSGFDGQPWAAIAELDLIRD